MDRINAQHPLQKQVHTLDKSIEVSKQCTNSGYGGITLRTTRTPLPPLSHANVHYFFFQRVGLSRNLWKGGTEWRMSSEGR